MLFFFEAAFFILAIVALALAEFSGRGQALGLWVTVTLASFLAGPALRTRLARTPPVDATEARWRQTLAASWRHLNVLLLLGLAALGAWWRLGMR